MTIEWGSQELSDEAFVRLSKRASTRTSGSDTPTTFSINRERRRAEINNTTYRHRTALVLSILVVAVPTWMLARDRAADRPFLKTLDAARAASRAQSWTHAIPLWRQVVEINPFAGSFWHELAWAHYQSGDCDQAGLAFKRVLTLGYGVRANVLYHMATCLAARGSVEPALEQLAEAAAAGYLRLDQIPTDPAWKPLSSHPRFRQIIGRPDVLTYRVSTAGKPISACCGAKSRARDAG